MKSRSFLLFLAAFALTGCGVGAPDKVARVEPAPARGHAPVAPELAAFAAEVDRICATTFAGAVAREDQIYALARENGWIERKTEALAHENWARNQANLHELTGELGDPPAKSRLFKRWRSNVAHRGRLFHEASIGWASGDSPRINRSRIRISGLKVDSDRIGYHFGLRGCAFTYPVATSDLDEIESRTRRYFAELEALCRRRNQKETRMKRRGQFTPNAAAGVRVWETWEMAAVHPRDPSHYVLRDRLLAAKRRLDSYSRWALKSTWRKGDRAWARAGAGITERAHAAQRELEEIGLRCPPWG